MFPRPNVPLFTSPFLPVSLSLALFSFFARSAGLKTISSFISVLHRQQQINCSHEHSFYYTSILARRTNSVLSAILLRESFFISLAEEDRFSLSGKRGLLRMYAPSRPCLPRPLFTVAATTSDIHFQTRHDLTSISDIPLFVTIILIMCTICKKGTSCALVITALICK